MYLEKLCENIDPSAHLSEITERKIRGCESSEIGLETPLGTPVVVCLDAHFDTCYFQLTGKFQPD